MDNTQLIPSIKKFLQHRYANYLNNEFTNRLILSDRQEILKYLGPETTTEQLEAAITNMITAGHILEDTGILITFSPSFLF